MNEETDKRITDLENKAIQVKLPATEQENLKNNLFAGVNGQNLNITWKNRTYEVAVVGVSVLSDGVSVDTDCNLGHLFTLTTTQSFTMSNPTNGVDGKKLIYKIKQDSTGSRVITWGASFRASVLGTLPVLSTTANYVDYIGFIYDGVTGYWNCLSDTQTFAT